MSQNAKDQGFQKLQEALQSENWDAAQTILKDAGFPEYITKYNQAFIDFKTGNLASAKAKLEFLRFNGMSSQEIDNALGEVNAALGVTEIIESETNFDQFVIGLNSMPTDLSTPLYLVATCLVLGLLAFKRWIIASVTGVIAIALTFIVCSYTSDKKVSIADTNYLVFDGPSRIFEELQEIPQGYKVIIDTSKNSEAKWKYISYPEFYRGWVYMYKGQEL